MDVIAYYHMYVLKFFVALIVVLGNAQFATCTMSDICALRVYMKACMYVCAGTYLLLAYFCVFCESVYAELDTGKIRFFKILKDL